MYSIEFRKIGKNYGDKEIIKNLNLSINQGERLVLLGPSGCGKTTILRMIAGLESISAGELSMGGRIINEVPAGERNIAMVFQSYALFPHMNVRENITFGLRIQKFPAQEIETRTKQALEILNLNGYELRKPKELSGGQKQRVALCRALVKHSPYFLLDEPLSNLDAQLRQQARTELVKIHELYKPTMIYVTHDQTEAMTVADRIAILNKGLLQQLDTPENVYNHPANTFVARFIGTPPMNLLQARINKNYALIGKQQWLELPAKLVTQIGSRENIILGIRPEKCHLAAPGLLQGKINYSENLGSQRIVRIALDSDEEVNICVPDNNYDLANAAGFEFDWEDVRIFDESTQENISAVNNNL